MRNIHACVLTVLVLLPSIGIAGDEPVNVRDLHKSHLSAVIGGVHFFGIAFDTFLSNKLNLELSAGMGFGAGMRYHFKGDNPDTHWSPYIGGYLGIVAVPDINLFGGSSSSSFDWKPDIYIPLGLHYISMSGKFALALEAGYMHLFKTDESRSCDIPMLALKWDVLFPWSLLF